MTSISSTTSSSYQYQSPFLRMDTNGDGKVTEDEFVSARPKEVDEAKSKALYAEISGGSTEGMTEEELAAAMEAARPSAEARFSGDMSAMMLDMQEASAAPPDATDLFSALDTDGDGTVSEAEFAEGRPDDVSEEQALALFASFDSEGTGSLTEDQFVAAMEANRPAGPPPGMPPAGDVSESDSEDSETASAASTTLDDLLARIRQVIEEYESLGTTEDDTADESTTTVTA
ncbi:EF-hand domain-containing protein [Rhizobium sp. TRM95111]|uniref:EF-hand domain-containing protein n=1 Tax=Rhizobium alarense TaxID=2846851 RepID=UPI001F16D0D3|nr:EF-hand domain-containing protein [Rhizobium alarense]MCF3639896.1 EF-hand domain-containing protein [Rhizobium alarense]